MTIPVPTVPVVKAALVTALKARTELTNVSVEYGPAGTFLDDDQILVGRAHGAFNVSRMVGGGGQWWLDEHYVLQVEVLSFRGDDDEQATEERAHTLAAVIVDTIRLDPSIGGRVNQATPVGWECDPDWDENNLGRHAKYLLDIAIDASV